MSKETFMLVSLKEEKAKKLAQAISSPACRRILDYLAVKEATETEISEKLKMPISTVHYNLVQLKESKLVEVDEYHYSKKGKEVAHYKLANKYIIIAPKENTNISEAFKNILPVSLILAAGVGTWQFIQNRMTSTIADGAMMLKAAVPEATPMLAARSADAAAFAVETTASVIQQPTWPWFVYGAAVAMILYVLVDCIRHKFKRN
jgi:DNA-binding transcriptional ArsR family regulator